MSRFSLSLVFFFLTQAAMASSATLDSLRSDLSSGSLEPVLSRQALVSLPGDALSRWVTGTEIQRFAITGFNENRARFAARIRVHFRGGAVGFLRLEGEPGERYRLTDWYDYSSGLRLSELAELGTAMTKGKAADFLSLLHEEPGNAELAALGKDLPELLPLWLTHCTGAPCESLAVQGQNDYSEPALWQLQQVMGEGDHAHYRKVSGRLRLAIGDDPYLWWLEGQLALQHRRCGWLHDPLVQAWERHQPHSPLADAALQCFLAARSEGTVFLDRLSEAVGDESVAGAIRDYFARQDLSVPPIYQDWAQSAGAQ